MIHSMTGFGGSKEVVLRKESGLHLELSVDIKTLNSKSFDLHLRVPQLYVPFEKEISSWLRQSIFRGRIDMNVRRKILEGRGEEISVNLDQARQVYQSFERVSEELELQDSPSLQHLLQIPDWLEAKELPASWEEEKVVLQQVVDKALKEVMEARKREGESLLHSQQTHLKDFDAAFDGLKEKCLGMLKELKQRLRERIDELKEDTAVDPQRIEQEIVLWVAKNDAQEELDRLKHHLAELKTAIQQGGVVGRRLEFILQEMHREINTLGSKSPSVSVTHQVIDLKTLVERMKEQAQNIE